MAYFIDTRAFSKSIQEGLFIPKIDSEYDEGTAILFNKAIYFANKRTIWTGTLTDDWDAYISAGGNNNIFSYEGIYDLISDLPTSANDGDYVFVREDQSTYFFYNESWQSAGRLIVGDLDSVDQSDLDELKEYVDNKDEEKVKESNDFTIEYVKKNSGKIVYDPTKTYVKDDEITLVPETYDSTLYPAGTYKTHLGQSIRYNADNTARRFDIKIRARIDGARDPISYPGEWYPCNPLDVIEQGKNSFGEYVLYADGTCQSYMSVYISSASKTIWTQSQRRPIYTVSYRYANVSPSNGVVSYFAITSIDSAGDTIIVTAHEVNNTASNWSGIIRIVSNDVWYWLN